MFARPSRAAYPNQTENDMAKTAKQPAGADLANLDIDLIDVKDGFNPRGDDVGDVADLVEMIRKREMLNTVVVCPGAKGRYFLIAGARRLKAVRELGHKTIAANIRHDITIDSPDALAIALVENDNEGRRALPPLAQARAFARLMETVPGASDTEKHKAIAKLMGRTSEGAYQNVRMTLRLLTVPEACSRLVENGGLTKWAAIAVSEAPEAIRDEVAARVKPGMSEQDVKRLVRDMTHEAANGGTDAAPVDLAAEEEAPENGDKPKTPGTRKPTLAPSTAKVDLAPSTRTFVMRNRSELDEKIDELVDDLLDAIEDEKEAEEAALRERLAALLWATGACGEISQKDKTFKAVLAKLIEKAENARGRKVVKD